MHFSGSLVTMSKLIEGCYYNPKASTMGFRMEGMGVIIGAKKIIVNNVKDESEARNVIDRIRGIRDITSK
jgi:ArsR family metal-binding transcriptional regulator